MSDESTGASIGTLHLMNGSSYTFLEKVGKGSQGVVYRAVDQTGKIVACKLLNEEPDEQSQKRFNKGRKHRPHLAHIIEHGFTAEPVPRYLIATNFVEGLTLEQALQAGETFPEQRALLVAEHLARGIKALHDDDLLHRDIKPSNAKIQDNEVTLLDFGLVRDAVMETFGGTLGAGSIKYAPREQLEGNATKQSDLYSLGLTLWELTTRQTVRLRYGLHTETRADCAVYDRLSYSNGFVDLIRSLTQDDPAKRPASIDDVLATIERIKRDGIEETALIPVEPTALAAQPSAVAVRSVYDIVAQLPQEEQDRYYALKNKRDFTQQMLDQYPRILSYALYALTDMMIIAAATTLHPGLVLLAELGVGVTVLGNGTNIYRKRKVRNLDEQIDIILETNPRLKELKQERRDARKSVSRYKQISYGITIGLMVLIPISSLPPLHSLVFYTLAVGASYLFYNTGTTDYKKILQRAESEIPAITGQETAQKKHSIWYKVRRMYERADVNRFKKGSYRRLHHIAARDYTTFIGEARAACGSEDSTTQELAKAMVRSYERHGDFRDTRPNILEDLSLSR